MNLTPIFESSIYYPNMLCYQLTAEALNKTENEEN